MDEMPMHFVVILGSTYLGDALVRVDYIDYRGDRGSCTPTGSEWIKRAYEYKTYRGAKTAANRWRDSCYGRLGPRIMILSEALKLLGSVQPRALEDIEQWRKETT